MARPKEAQYVPCHCERCSGKMIDQANWLLHNGRVTSGMVDQQEKMWFMGEWWVRETLTKG